MNFKIDVSNISSGELYGPQDGSQTRDTATMVFYDLATATKGEGRGLHNSQDTLELWLRHVGRESVWFRSRWCAFPSELG